MFILSIFKCSHCGDPVPASFGVDASVLVFLRSGQRPELPQILSFSYEEYHLKPIYLPNML